jgi:hypothetical protein
MLAQLKQVAITYVTRPTPLEWLLYLVILPLFWTLSFVDREEPQLLGVYMCVVLAMLPALAVNNQLRWQCSHPRARLMPGFCGPHLAIAWATLAVYAVAAPLIAQWNSPYSVWPFLCCAAIGAAIVQQSPRVASLTSPLFLVCLLSKDYLDNAAVADWLNAVGYRRPVLISATLLAWTAVIVRDLAFTRQREDHRGYQPPVVADRGKPLSRTFRMARERAASVESARRLDRSWWTSSRTDRRIAAAPRLSAWRKLDIAFSEPKPPLAIIAGSATTLVLWGMITYSSFQREGAWDAEHLPGLIFFAAIIVAMAAAGPATSLARRLPLMTAERLHPLSKQAYADSILRVCLWRSVRYWLLLQLLVAFVVFALPWQGLEPIRPDHVAGYFIVSLAGLTCGCGVSFLFSVFPGLISLLIAAVIIAASTLGLQLYWSKLRPDDSQTTAVVWAIIFATIGIGCGFIGRIEWRDKEYAASLSDRFS